MDKDALTFEILLFPLAHRIGKVRHVADLLERKQDEHADAYWKSTVRGLADQLARVGMKHDAIIAEIFAFQEAVQAELWRRSGKSSRPRGGGAA
ncbi:DUF6074 family protein [Aminobacter aminovorans]|uniref:Uncharacterized protein n=1 Tax=Aminobacter aminovorans TaxID=83263 RepID=A0ABR6H7S8_AMIAI|nr:DUF6074 family protein [Aminobacter aminovorans]MBB3706560.1 hypothetical protein [Aminobacter aminovorans]